MYQTGNGEKFLHFQVLQLCCWNHGNSHVSDRRHFWVLGLALAGGTVAAEGVAIAVPWQDQLLAGRQAGLLLSAVSTQSQGVGWAKPEPTLLLSPTSATTITAIKGNHFIDCCLQKQQMVFADSCPSHNLYHLLLLLPPPHCSFCLLVLHSLANKCSWLLQQEGRTIFIFTAEINYWLCLVLSSMRRWQAPVACPALTSHGAGDPDCYQSLLHCSYSLFNFINHNNATPTVNTKHSQTPCPLFRVSGSCGGQAEHSQWVILAVSNPSLFLTVASHPLIHFWSGQQLCRAGSCFGL